MSARELKTVKYKYSYVFKICGNEKKSNIHVWSVARANKHSDGVFIWIIIVKMPII